MRRTASWGSRDAFTDGHISSHSAPREVPTGRRTLAATSRAHRSKRYHAKFPQDRTSFSEPDAERELVHKRVIGTHNDEAARRRSAPDAPQHRRTQQDPRALRPAASDDSDLSAQSQDRTSAQARAAIARAVLCPKPALHDSQQSSSHQLSQAPQSGSHHHQDASYGADLDGKPHRLRHSQSGHASLSYANIQHNLLTPYTAAPQAVRPSSGRSSLVALPEEAPVDYDMDSSSLQALADNSGSRGAGLNAVQSKGAASDAQRAMNIRPSMEARRRRLGSSALQVRHQAAATFASC